MITPSAARMCAGVLLLVALVGSASTECRFGKRHRALANGAVLYEDPADANLTNVPEEYVLRFDCDVGYLRTQPEMIACFDGRWSSRPPRCVKVQCPEPPRIENGQSEVKKGVNEQPTVGATASYACDPGYSLDNDTVLECVLVRGSNTARWNGSAPGCIEKEVCPEPGTSSDGTRSGGCCFTGDSLGYECEEGFELVGPRTISCMHGGEWTAPRPRCRPLGPHCEDPPEIRHGRAEGRKSGDYYLSDQEVEIFCDAGYAYQGPSEFVSCEEDIGWDEEFGHCGESYCERPDIPSNGSIAELETNNATAFAFDFTLTYVCHPGFRLIGDSWRYCDRSRWSGSEPHCEVIRCPDPGVPENGGRSGDSFDVGDRVQFRCFTGFELIGSMERFCMANGQWNGELTRCDTAGNFCEDPGVPISGWKNSSTYNEGDRVGFGCRGGLSLVGSAVRECLPNRTWTGEEARCLAAYDFDSGASVSAILRQAVSEKAAEQRAALAKYNRARTAQASGGVVGRGRVLDINHPGRLIFYFVFDVSGSIRQQNFQRSINFAKAMVKKVGITPKGARAGALTFSSKAEIQFMPVAYDNTAAVLKALDDIEYTGGGTSTNSALSLVREQTIPHTQAIFGKKGIKSVVFILTDGKANMGGDPEDQAQKLKKAGVEIYCVGVTGSNAKDSLQRVASDPKDEHVFVLDNFVRLDWLIQEITAGAIDYSECGLGMESVRRRAQRPKIVGGRKASEPWPWMAALYLAETSSLSLAEAELKCGASILNRRYILTAAHCLYDLENKLREPRHIIVTLGLKDLRNQTSHRQEKEVSDFHYHEGYRHGVSFDHDVALLHLASPIEFDRFVRPICLPPRELVAESPLYGAGEFAYAIGWGHEGVVKKNQQVDTRTSDDLKELGMPLQERARCMQSVLDNGGSREMFTDNMFCAGTGLGGEDTCQGDSGGPLMQAQYNSERDLFWTQVGIVSWGIQGSCGLVDTYGYYTHVHRYLDWIDRKMRTAQP